MRLRIRSDGTLLGTIIENEETGEKLVNVTEITWTLSAKDFPKLAIVQLTVIDVPVDAVGEVTDVRHTT